MGRTASPAQTEVISASAAGRIGGGALLFSGLSNLASVVSLPDGFTGRSAGMWLCLAIFAIALVTFVVPWDDLGPRSTVVMIPIAFALIAVGNYTDPMPYVAGIYLVLLGAWIGLCHPRFTTLALTPVFAAVYWIPLAARPHLERLSTSAVIITAVSVSIGEVLGTLRTSLEQSRLKLTRTTERRFEALSRNSVDVTLVFGLNDLIRYASPAVEARFGYSAGELESIPLERFLTEMVDGLSDETRSALLNGTYMPSGEDEAHELRLRHADGTWIDVEATAQNLVEDPDIGGIVIHVRDIRGRKSLENDLHFKAFHDDLTGLANRAAFRNEIRRAKESSEEICVVFMDLDGFKAVNDTAGHRQGDRLLQLVADRLKTVAPADSAVARLGGDEFAVMIRSSLDEAEAIALRIVAHLSEPFALDDMVVSVGASAGVAIADLKSSDDQVIGDADTAMYEAKVSPTCNVARFEPTMRTRLLEKLDARTRLQNALERDEFVLHFQPAVDLKTGMPVGAESLVRWNSPGVGLVPPSQFIGMAEESGVIVEMGRWVLREACREAASWTTVGPEPLAVAVNVSPRQFQDPELLSDIASALRLAGLPPDRLIIEITESILIADIDTAEARLRALREMGIRLALDDFGTGYSSLSYLQALPFDVLKIDRCFVEHVTTRASDLSLLQTINRLGHDLGLKTLVEGIETQAQADLVTALGCDLAQGFHYAKPTPGPDLWTESVPATFAPAIATGSTETRALL